MSGAGTGTPAESPAANVILTPASLLAKLKIKFGGTDAGSTDRVTLLTDVLKLAGAYVWYYAPWQFRHRILTLTTEADVAYTVLPTDYERDARAGDWLVDVSDNRPVYVSSAQFAVESARLSSTSGVPEIWTLGNEVIAGVTTPVVRWAPTPSAIYNFEGFQYFCAMPAIDSTSAVTFMPSIGFDILWDKVATRMAADDLVTPEGVAVPPWAVILELLEDARAKYGYRGLSGPPHDYYRDSDDLSVIPGGYGWDHDLAL